MPAAEAVLVEQAEVEEPGDSRLAVREQDRVAQLRRLVDDVLVVARRQCRNRVQVVLAAVVVAQLVGRRNGLETVLDVPDRHAADARHGLGRVLEGCAQDVHQSLVVALRDQVRALVQDPGRLRGVRWVWVVAERVEELARPPARAIGVPQGEDEAPRIVAGSRRADDVDRPRAVVQDVVAARKQRGVPRRAVRFGPVGGRVGLVPDLDVVDERNAPNDAAEERAVLLPEASGRRCVAGGVVHREHDAVVQLHHPCDPVQVDLLEPRRPHLSGLPGNRHPDRHEAEVAMDADDPVLPVHPLGGVVGDADDDLQMSRLGRLRRPGGDGEREQSE